MKLTYKGPATAGRRGALPLPEGWPGRDHDEPDAEVAKAKIASGMYDEAGRPARAAATKPEEGEED